MKIAYENSLGVNIENPIVVDYVKTDRTHVMPHMHTHPYYEINILISGNRKYFFHNRVVELHSHDILIIKPNDAHRALPIEEAHYERYTLNIDPSLCFQIEKYNDNIKKIFKNEIFHLNNDSFYRLLNIIKHIDEERKKSKEYSYSVRNHTERVFIELFLYGNCIMRTSRLKKNDTRLEAALDYISENYAHNISVEMCAKLCCMSKSNFARIFHDVVGVNFKDYINSVRIKKAGELLSETDLSISEVSDKVGFDSLSYFCYVFKKHINMSPKDYKNKHIRL